MSLYTVKDRTLHIVLPEEIDHYHSGQIAREADRILIESDVIKIVFDFADTRFMDSSGIGLLVGRYRKMVSVGGSIFLENVNSQIGKVLRLSGIEKILGKSEGLI